VLFPCYHAAGYLPSGNEFGIVVELLQTLVDENLSLNSEDEKNACKLLYLQRLERLEFDKSYHVANKLYNSGKNPE
jgi:hypothetical protein